MAAEPLDSNWKKSVHSSSTWELQQYWNVRGWIVRVTVFYNQNSNDGSSATAIVLNRQTMDVSDLCIDMHPLHWAGKVAAIRADEPPEGVLLAADTLVARMEKILSSL